jgi:hypothetical protein
MGDDNKNTASAYAITGRYRFPRMGDMMEGKRILDKMYIIEWQRKSMNLHWP